MGDLKLVGSQELAFSGPRGLGVVQTRLRELGFGEWGEGESHYYGDYLGLGWKREIASGWVRIYAVDGVFYCKFRLWSDKPEMAAREWQEIRAWVMGDLLPALGAEGVRESNEID